MAAIAETDLRATEAAPPGAALAVLFLCWLMALLDRMVILILVPSIKGALHLTDTQISLLHGTAFSICFALAGLPFGRLVDRFNRRNLLMIGLAGWSVGSIACGLAHSFAGLFAARMVVGVFQAVLSPATFSMVTDYYPAERRGRVVGLLISGATVGVAISSMAGGALLDWLAGAGPWPNPFGGSLAPWQSTFVLAGLPGLLLAPALLAVREPVRRATAGLAQFDLLAFLKTNRRTFGPLYAGFALTLITGYGLSAWFPVIFMRNLHLPAHKAGLYVGVINLIGALSAAAIGGWLSDRFATRDPRVGRLRVARVLTLVSALALLPLAYVGFPGAAFATFAVFSFMGTAISSICNTVFPELTPSEGRGQVLALFQFISYVFALGFAPTLVALVSDQVLKNENQLNIAMLVVGAPCMAMATLFISLAIPNVAKLRAAAAA